MYKSEDNKSMFTSRRMEQQCNRLQAIKMLKNKFPVKDVAEIFNVSTRAVYGWLDKFEKFGEEGLLARQGAGRPSKVSPEQMCWIASTVKNDTPANWGFDVKLWTLSHIRQVVESGLGLSLCQPTMSKVMKKLEFTPQRPLRRAWQQDAVLVEQWLETELPALRQRAQETGAQLMFADEASIRMDYHAGTTWAPRGKTPIVQAAGTRESVNMISAVSTAGKLQFMLIDGPGNSHTFKNFLENLVHDSSSPIMLIVDNHRSHKSELVMNYVESTKGKIELHYIPPYSPQLNPDEQVWKNIKERVAKRCPSDKYELRASIRNAFELLQKMPETILGFFRHPECGFVN